MMALVALALLAPSPDAIAAEDAYKAGDYETALEYIERAYEQDPQPKYLFGWAASLENLGRYEEAIVIYETFLATAPERDDAEQAYAKIQACRRKLEELERAQEQDGPSRPPGPTEAPPPADDDPMHTGRPWHRDPLGGVLAASGLALAVAGGVIIGVGAQRRLDADGPTEEVFRNEVRRSNTLQGVGIGLAASGALLITGAVIRYVKVERASSGRGLAIRF